MSARRVWVVARNELAFNARRPMFYICLTAVGLIIWGLSTGNVSIVIASGDATVGGKKAFITSEFAAAQILAVSVATLISFFVAAVVVDPNVRVLQLRRQSAEAKLLGLSRPVRDHGGAGRFEIIVALARGTRLRRPPLATFEPTGTRLLARTTPVSRCLSLLARRRLRRAPGPDGTYRDPDTARWSTRIAARPAPRSEQLCAPNKRRHAPSGSRACCSLLTVRPSVAGGGVGP